MIRNALAVLLCALASISPGSARAAADRVVVETAYLSRGNYVPATVVIPLAGAGEKLPLVVMAHGHAGSRDEAGAFRQLATVLARRQIASIRMDFPGHGDNPAPSSDNNLETMLQDLSAARLFAQDELPIDPERVAIVGYNLGGRLALLATQTDDYAALALWAPLGLDGAAGMYMAVGGSRAWERLRGDAEQSGVARVATFGGTELELGRQWFLDLEQTHPEAALGAYRGPVMILHGTADRVVQPDSSRALAAAAGPQATVEAHFIDGAGHGLGFQSQDPSVSGKVLRLTADFLSRHLAAPILSHASD